LGKREGKRDKQACKVFADSRKAYTKLIHNLMIPKHFFSNVVALNYFGTLL
jgi:hypothetical protein